jgi:hypothetical protein
VWAENIVPSRRATVVGRRDTDTDQQRNMGAGTPKALKRLLVQAYVVHGESRTPLVLRRY